MKLFNSVIFLCNICESRNIKNITSLSREEPSCRKCGSTVRMRGIVHLVSLALFNKSIPLTRFPKTKEIFGIGMSDWEGYANPLEMSLSYQNTFYHKEPKLDITKIPIEKERTLDFIISADVYEHIETPVSRAFENTKKLLKPGGSFIFTIPFTLEGDETVEHFPELYQYKILQDEKGEYFLENYTKENSKQIYKNLIFHGGPGSTLEMRVFSKNSVIRELKNAGFTEIQILEDPIWKYGIYQKEAWSLPIRAR